MLPAYNNINVEVRRISIFIKPDAGKSAWIDLPTYNGIYDLIKLHYSDTALLERAKIPSGKISEIKFLFGYRNSLVINGSIRDLIMPYGLESQVQLSHEVVINSDESFSLRLDFDAKASVIDTTSGAPQLIPVIRNF